MSSLPLPRAAYALAENSSVDVYFDADPLFLTSSTAATGLSHNTTLDVEGSRTGASPRPTRPHAHLYDLSGVLDDSYIGAVAPSASSAADGEPSAHDKAPWHGLLRWQSHADPAPVSASRDVHQRLLHDLAPPEHVVDWTDRRRASEKKQHDEMASQHAPRPMGPTAMSSTPGVLSPSHAALQRRILSLQQTMAAKDERIRELRTSLAAYESFFFSDGLVASLYNLMLAQHRSLLSVATRATASAAVTASEVTAAESRDVRFREEAAFLSAELKREHAAEQQRLQGRLARVEADLASAVAHCEEIMAENRALKECVRQRQQEQRMGQTSRSVTPPSARSPLRTRRFASDATLLQRLRRPIIMVDLGVATDACRDGNVSSERRNTVSFTSPRDGTGGSGSAHTDEECVRWMIEARALRQEYDTLLERWIAAAALSETLQAQHRTDTLEAAVLRADIQRLRLLLHDISASRGAGAFQHSQQAQSSAQHPHEVCAGSRSPPKVSSTPTKSMSAIMRGAGAGDGRDSGREADAAAADGGGGCSPLEALATAGSSIGIVSPASDGATEPSGMQPPSSSAAISVASTVPSMVSWDAFLTELVERLEAAGALLNERLEASAHALASRACCTPLPGPANVNGKPIGGADTSKRRSSGGDGVDEADSSRAVEPPTTLTFHRSVQCLRWSSTFYAVVAAQAQATLTHFQDKLKVLERHEWNARVARKVLGGDHERALRSLVHCMKELVVEKGEKN